MKIKTITVELSLREAVLLAHLLGQLTGEQYSKAGISASDRDVLLNLMATLSDPARSEIKGA